MSESKVEIKKQTQTGFELMDSSKFEIIQKNEADSLLRLHHLAQMWYIVMSGEELVEYDPETREIFKELTKTSDIDLTDSEKHAISTKYSKASLKLVQYELKNSKNSLSSNNEASEYIGKNGEYAEEFRAKLDEQIYELLNLKSESKVELTFEPDKICVSTQGGRGPVAHCSTDEIFKQDMAIWFSVNDVISRNPEFYNEAGLVDNRDGSFGIWVKASLLRNIKFLEKVKKRDIELTQQLVQS